MCARMWVRGCVCGCAPHLANISKIVQDATRATTTRATTTEHRNTSDHRKKGGTPAKQNLLLMGDLNGNNEKKLKKNWK